MRRILPAHDLEKLVARASFLPADDPLWLMLIALVRANLAIETEAVAKAGIDDAEAHRARGRVGMLLDLETQLQQVWDASHKIQGG